MLVNVDKNHSLLSGQLFSELSSVNGAVGLMSFACAF